MVYSNKWDYAIKILQLTLKSIFSIRQCDPTKREFGKIKMFPFKERNTDEMPLFLCAFRSLSSWELPSRQGRAPGLLIAVVSKTLGAIARELGKSLDWKPRGLSPKLNVALTTRNNGTAGDLWRLSSLSKRCYRTIIAEFLCFVPIMAVLKLI